MLFDTAVEQGTYERAVGAGSLFSSFHAVGGCILFFRGGRPHIVGYFSPYSGATLDGQLADY